MRHIKRLARTWILGVSLTGWASAGWAAAPYLLLGPADEIALDQPRVAIELIDPATGRSLGPGLANTFLLDTGANGILAVDDSVAELMQKGYRTEGTYFEQGVGGFTEFDVSAPYDMRVGGSNGQFITLEDARLLSSTTESFCPLPGLCSFFGIVGMPAMNGRVTTLDLSSLAGEGGGMDIDDLFNGDFSVGFLDTRFFDNLPSTNLRRISVPVQSLSFPREGDGPLPTWADLPQLKVTTGHQGGKSTGNFVLDTGAQLSILSSKMAFEMGLDANGNGTLDDEAVAFQDIGGVGGTISAPVLQFEELSLPTDQGFDLKFTNLQMAVVDIDPTIDGIFGMNMLSSGWSGSIFGSLSDLAELLGEAGFADLLEELGGLGINGEGAPFGYFQKVHFDFRNMDTGQGRIVLDLMPEVSGPLSADGKHGDLDGDLDVDLEDRARWVHNVKRTTFGDANLDGLFDSRDLVNVFAAGQYEDSLVDNSKWETGDWNGDCEFTTQDLVLAFQDGGYERSAAAAPIPEPAAAGFLSLLVFGAMRKRR